MGWDGMYVLVVEGNALGVDNIERLSEALGLKQGPRIFAPPPARWPPEEMEFRMLRGAGGLFVGRWGGSEDMNPVAAPGEGRVEGQRVALHAAGHG